MRTDRRSLTGSVRQAATRGSGAASGRSLARSQLAYKLLQGRISLRREPCRAVGPNELERYRSDRPMGRRARTSPQRFAPQRTFLSTAPTRPPTRGLSPVPELVAGPEDQGRDEERFADEDEDFEPAHGFLPLPQPGGRTPRAPSRTRGSRKTGSDVRRPPRSDPSVGHIPVRAFRHQETASKMNCQDGAGENKVKRWLTCSSTHKENAGDFARLAHAKQDRRKTPIGFVLPKSTCPGSLRPGL